MKKSLVCFAHGRDGQWEAICEDFDISVAGRSLEEVQQLLKHAIVTYVQDAMKEDEVTREALLNRRAPWHVRAQHVVAFAWSALRSQRRVGHESQVPFSVPCHA